VAMALVALPVSQLGHMVAYVARHGGEGLAIESRDVHAYFPLVLSWSGLLVGSLTLGALLVLGLGRLAVGRALGLATAERQSLPELFLVAAAVQMNVFMAQETVESLVAGEPLDGAFVVSTLFWGAVSQLPIALLGAVALRWLSVRLVALCATPLSDALAAIRPPAPLTIVRRWLPQVEAPRPADWGPGALVTRGPPTLLHVI
jgi:hypothetical protein